MTKLATWSTAMPTVTLIDSYKVHSHHAAIGQRKTSSERSIRNALGTLEAKGLIIRTEQRTGANDRPCVAWVRADREFLLDPEIDDDEKEWLNLPADVVTAQIKASGQRAVVTRRAGDSLNTSALTCADEY